MSDPSLQILLDLHAEQVNDGARSPLEIIASATEELGEVAAEVLLFEGVGSKRKWKRRGEVGSITAELGDLIVNLFCLAHHYDIDLEGHVRDRVGDERGV